MGCEHIMQCPPTERVGSGTGSRPMNGLTMACGIRASLDTRHCCWDNGAGKVRSTPEQTRMLNNAPETASASHRLN